MQPLEIGHFRPKFMLHICIIKSRQSPKIMAKKLTIKAYASNGRGVLKVSGYIGGWKANADDIDMEVERMLSDGITDIDVHMNSYGGSLIDGNQIANIIKRFSGEKVGYIGAVCASACTVVACACDRVFIAKNGMYMVHRPMISAEGNEDEFESKLAALRAFQKTLVTMYAARTGKTEDYIISKWKTDWWMTATDAKTEGFVDEVDGEATIEPEDAAELVALGYENTPDFFKVAANATPPAQPKPENEYLNEMEKKALIAALGLPATASDTEIQAAVTANKAAADKVAEMERTTATAAADALKAKAEVLVDGAIAAKKITANLREAHIKLAMADYDSAKAALDAISPAERITTTATGAAGGATTGDRKDWDYQKYAENDPKALMAMAQKDHPDHETFKALFKARYNKDYIG